MRFIERTVDNQNSESSLNNSFVYTVSPLKLKQKCLLLIWEITSFSNVLRCLYQPYLDSLINHSEQLLLV